MDIVQQAITEARKAGNDFDLHVELTTGTVLMGANPEIFHQTNLVMDTYEIGESTRDMQRTIIRLQHVVRAWWEPIIRFDDDA